MNDKINFTGAVLHQGQEEIVYDILNSDSMFYTVNTPRQFGKSFMAIQLMLYFALNNPNSKLMFTTPVYSQVSKVFQELVNGVRNSGVIKSFNRAENSILFINNSELYFKSVKLPDNLRGYSIDYLICDEAALYKKGIFGTVLRPMLAVRGKKCILLSTPKGKNFFYSFYMKGLNSDEPRYRCYKGSSDKNPYANREEIEDARKSLPGAVFKQEYLAEFIDDGGDIFTNINVNSTIKEWIGPQPDESYYAGVDLGRQNDFTVLTILDSKGRICYIYRQNQQEWTKMIDEMVVVLKRYKPRTTLVECNGIGDVVFDLMKKKYPNITAWITSGPSKIDIIEKLILSLQEKRISLPTKELFEPLHNELMDFSFTYNKSTRHIRYAARTGHDDTVMSLAIAVEAKSSGINKGSYNISVV